MLCQIVFQNRLTDLQLLGELRPELEQAQALNREMQMFFRRWHAVSRDRNPAVMLDQRELDWFVAMNRGLHDPLSTGQTLARVREMVATMQQLAVAIGTRASALCPGLEPPETGNAVAAVGPSLFPLAA